MLIFSIPLSLPLAGRASFAVAPPDCALRGARAGHAPALRVAGDSDRDEQCRAVEQRLDKERRAELLDAGDADRQDRHADDGAPDVDPAGLDRRRAEEGADQRGQQIFEADARLADAQLARRAGRRRRR